MTVYIKQLNYVVLIENPKLRNLASIYLYGFDILIVAGMSLFLEPSYLHLVIFILLKEFIYLIISFANLRISVFSVRPTPKRLFTYTKYGFIPMLTIILMTINYRIDILALNGNVSTAQIGIYSLGVMIAERVWLIPDAIKDIVMSRLVKGSNEKEVAVVIKYGFWSSLISVGVIAALGKPFLNILFGSQFEGVYPITLIMMVGVVGMVFYKMVYAYNVVNGKKVINFVFLGLAAVINVIGNYMTIPIWGIYGAAMSSVVSYTFCGIAFLVYFKKESSVSYKSMFCITKQDILYFKSIVVRKK